MDDAMLFRTIRRKDRLMPVAGMADLLRRGEYGVLSMCGADGYGYGVPLNYAYEPGPHPMSTNPVRAASAAPELFAGNGAVSSGSARAEAPDVAPRVGELGRVYFHCASSGNKLDILACNNRVTFTLVGPTRIVPQEFSADYSSVLLAGRVRKAVSAAEMRWGLMLLVRKYSPEFLDEGAAYIEKYLPRVTVVCLEVEYVSGKRRGQI